MFDCSHKRYNSMSFERTFKSLQKKLPPAYRVELKYTTNAASFASVELKTSKSTKRKRFVLEMDTMQCEDVAIENLMHEWAHMISWSVGNNWTDWQEHHGPEFGVAYSRVYQALVEK